MKKIALLILFICFNIILGQVDYQTEIQTIFNANCTSCHINGGAYQQGLDLSSYDNLMAGSNNGAVIVPGDHANSLLWQKVNSGEMPPGNNPDLSSDEINLIAQWIDEGALEIVGCADGEVELWDECYSIENTTELDLSDSELSGEIPPEIGNLNNLAYLNLRSNQLTGSIAPEIGNLINLIRLDLYQNQLTGFIPQEIGNLTELEFLDLGENQLTGEIPPEIGNLTNLTFLGLFINQLTGEIPLNIGNLTNLLGLWLFDNQLTGVIPPEIGILTNLSKLYLADNQLTGSIPPEIGNLTNLTRLYLADNQLTGSIHPEIGSLTNLTRLYLFNNQLTGEIPFEIGDLTNLERLKLHTNQLTGSIPETLCDLSDLTWSLEDSSWSVSTLFDNQLCPPYHSCIEEYVGEQNITECVYPVWHVATTGSDDNDGSEENPFATIQTGIDASTDGDTVLVESGTYLENIDYNGKNIAVIGEDRETTIIDGNQSGTVVTFENEEDTTTVLMGFTIQNGLSENGGAISCYYSYPVIKDVLIQNNSVSNSGGGLFCSSSSLTLISVIISNNSASNDGGGIDCREGSFLTIIDSEISNNSCLSGGGGIAFHHGSNSDLENVTISNNSDVVGEGGIFASEASIINVTNSISTFNYPNNISLYGESGNQITITYSNIEGGEEGIFTNDYGTVYWGVGNIDVNPLFCNADSGDYTLASNSPALGSGEGGANMGAYGVGCEAIILAPVLSDIDNQQIAEDGALTIEISATSDMGLDMTFSVYSDTSDVIVSLDNTTLTATPTSDWYGTANVTVMVTDEDELSDTTDFTLTVTPVNDSPEAFTVIYPTVSDTFSTHIDNDTLIAFVWEESYDVDSDVTYTLTIELEFFGNTYTDVHENISDTTYNVSSNSLDALLGGLNIDETEVNWYVQASDEEYTVESNTGSFVLSRVSLSVINGEMIPQIFALHQNYPNPFNPVTTLRYDLPEDAMVNITIYDMMGRVVKTLLNDQQTAGYRSLQWNATNNAGSPLSAGMYLYTIQAGDFRQTKKMVLLK